MFVIGPDKRRPGGHWFAEHGLIEKIHRRPDADGRIRVTHRRVNTPLNRIRRWLPRLFATVKFMELSPFGVTNMANTNVQPMDGRLFVGYDAGRPIEVDPETLAYVTPVGASDEWMQALPGLLEPLCSVAAHPAPDDPDDGYIVVVVHQDGPKEIQIFDAQHIEAGPLARASSPTFNPSLLLHSCWMADRVGPRQSTYRISLARDIRGALRGLPGVARSMAATGRAMLPSLSSLLKLVWSANDGRCS